MWGLYSLSAPSILISTVLYWTVEYDRGRVDVSMENLMSHGIVMLMMLVDGLVIGRIPMRIKQIVYIFIATVAFIVWTVIDDLIVKGNDTAKDAVGNVFNWGTNPLWAALWTTIALLLIVPVAFYVIWAASLWSRWCKFDGSLRRLCSEDTASGGGRNGGLDQRRYRKGLV